MGWISFRVEKGVKTIDVLRAEFDDKWTIIDHATAAPATYIVADNNETRKRVLFVFLVIRRNGEFCYKDMDENMGPNEHRCPDRLLDLMPPTDDNSGYAAEFRARCRAWNAEQRSKPKVTPGTRIKLLRPLGFSDGVERDTFTFVERTKFRSDDGCLVRLPGWKGLSFSLA